MERTISVLLAMVLTMLTTPCGVQLISKEQAKQAVYTFESDNSLKFQKFELEEECDGPEWSHAYTYSLIHADYPEPDRSWIVDALSGEVIWAYYGDRIPDQESAVPIGPLTEEQCRQIAEQFARTKYREFDTMGFQLGSSEWTGTGWSFEWEQIVTYGARTPNLVTVDVNPVDGSIQVYSAHRFPTPSPREPQITPQQAIDLARQSTAIVTVTFVSDPCLSADPDGSVWWGLEIQGLDAQGVELSYAVLLNAETGEVIESSPSSKAIAADKRSLSASAKTNAASSWGKEPQMVGARTPLAARKYGICWIPASHELRAVRGRNKVILRVGDRRSTINGKDIELDTAPRLIGGRVQVSPATLKLIP